jgi:hypothetical protein
VRSRVGARAAARKDRPAFRIAGRVTGNGVETKGIRTGRVRRPDAGRFRRKATSIRALSSLGTDGTARPHGRRCRGRAGSRPGRRSRVVSARKGSVSATPNWEDFRKRARQEESSPAAHGRCPTVELARVG